MQQFIKLIQVKPLSICANLPSWFICMPTFPSVSEQRAARVVMLLHLGIGGMEKEWNLSRITHKGYVGGKYRIRFLRFVFSVFSVHALLCCTI